MLLASLFGFLLSLSPLGDLRAFEFVALSLALSLRRPFLGARLGSLSFVVRHRHSSPLSRGLASAETFGTCPRRIR